MPFETLPKHINVYFLMKICCCCFPLQCAVAKLRIQFGQISQQEVTTTVSEVVLKLLFILKHFSVYAVCCVHTHNNFLKAFEICLFFSLWRLDLLTRMLANRLMQLTLFLHVVNVHPYLGCE